MTEIIKRYDLVIPIGRFCHCAGLLNNYGLKLFDGPWDWSGTGREEGIYKRLEALTQGFDGWFEREDFVLMDPQYSHEIAEKAGYLALRPTVNPPANSIVGLTASSVKSVWDAKREDDNIIKDNTPNPEVRYYNKKTLTYYGHDFFQLPDFNEQFKNFKSKYGRRCYRLFEFFKAADSILLVYMNNFADQRKELPLDRLKVIDIMNKVRHCYQNKIIDLYMFDHQDAINNSRREIWDVGIIDYLSDHYWVYSPEDADYRHRVHGFMAPVEICKIIEQIGLTDKFKMI